MKVGLTQPGNGLLNGSGAQELPEESHPEMTHPDFNITARAPFRGPKLEGMEKPVDKEPQIYPIVRTAFSAIAQEVFRANSDFVAGLKPSP